MTKQSESGSALTGGIRWDKDEVSAALDILEKERSNHLDYLTGILNEYHHAEHDSSHYDLLCGEWLLTFSHVLYAAYLHVVRGLPCVQWSRSTPVFSDYRHFLGCIVEKPEFSEQIKAHVSSVLAGEDEEKSGFATSSIRVGSEIESGFRRHLRTWKRKTTGTLAQKDVPFYFCHPHLNRCSRLEWTSTLWKWRRWAREENLDYPIESTVLIDADWRSKTSKAHQGGTFSDIMHRMIPLYLPAVYLEAFDSLRTQAHALKIPRPTAIYTANSLHGHTLFKFLAADWRLDGTKILNHQHGGNYGLDRIHAVENYETRVADRFYTLGWTGESPKQTVLPWPMFPKASKEINKKSILLNCIAYPAPVYRIHFQPMSGTIATMLEESVAFVKEMKGRARMTLRPSPNDYAMRTVDTLSAIDTNIAIDDLQTAGVNSYMASDLVVHSYLGTSWLETLALDIPTVVFFDPEIYSWREASLKLVEALKNVGILHESGGDAGKFVRTIWENPRLWWNQSGVQNARNEFVSHYARFSTDWSALWQNEFCRWIDKA